MQSVAPRSWTVSDRETWSMLFNRLAHCRAEQAHPIFQVGLDLLGINGAGIPDLNDVNRRLDNLTGWQGVFVEGLVDGGEFLVDLAARKFPIGNFIRDQSDLNYTPAPDIFHDLYGHLPFLANKDYARFCEELGHIAVGIKGNKLKTRMCERLFWFGVEFPLVETAKGRRIFGGGILSSYGESNYCLSSEPTIVPFSLEDIVSRDYDIDKMQDRLYLLQSPDELYSCTDELRKILNRST